MKPADIYAMPSLSETPWHDNYASLPKFLGDDEAEFASRDGVDIETPLMVQRKLSRDVDHERSISYDAYTWNGRPVALLVISGRGGNENAFRLITDLPGFLEAKAYVRAQLDLDSEIKADVVGAGDSIEGLDRPYGHIVLVDEAGPRLISQEHLDADSNMMFDQDAFRAAVVATVPSTFGTSRRDEATRAEMELGLAGERMRALAVAAVVEAIPDGADRTEDFDPVPAALPEGGKYHLSETLALARNAEGTYAIGLRSYVNRSHFAWTTGIALQRIGSPELYDALARDAAPVTTPR